MRRFADLVRVGALALALASLAGWLIDALVEPGLAGALVD